MRWRKQNNKLPNRNNQTLDSFISGIDSNSSNQSKRKSNVIPKIKVPASSGLEAVTKPFSSPFMYPQYPQFREYQYSIALKCITENTLVCLPTGLGKTHIASVIMLNFHLWFPDNLIFFLAPTKPLVNQQSMSLSNFSQYVPQSCIYSLTGSIQSQKRVKAYQQKRVFFCTPQTLQNDLIQNRLNPKQIILIIFDQAHKGVGNYSYANIVRFMDRYRFGYRIIGLSATPGNDHDRIQQVLQNLQIAQMIVKSDQDPDVKKYIKKKTIEPIYIQNTSIIKQVQKILQQFISWPLNQLLKFRLFDRHLAGGKYGFNSKCFHLINQQIVQRINKMPYKIIHMVNSAKCFLKFLADSLSLLREAGYESFKQKFIYQIQSIQSQPGFIFEKPKINQNFIKVIKQHPGYKRIKQLFQGKTSAGSHPKLQKLRDLLYSFFSNKQNIQNKSKVIIFANIRYTCHQIHKYLGQNPYCQIIKSQIFLGQAKTTVQTREGLTSITQTLQLSQKQQINLIKRYKANEINTLISTSIGQEGLDIGQVDAIFCYEGGMSTIRMVQRMGRTGRKRDGTVYVMLMQGKQSQDYQKANKKTQKMKKTNAKKYKYYSYNPVLFQQYSEIPIHFFSKPLLQQNNHQQDQPSKSQSLTKRKKSKQTKADQKKTKKKILIQYSKIQQASNSQQNDESNLSQNSKQLKIQQLKLSIKKSKKQPKLYKKTINQSTKITNQPFESSEDQKQQKQQSQQSQQNQQSKYNQQTKQYSQDDSVNEQQYDSTYENNTSDDTQLGQYVNINGEGNTQFNKLFNLDKIYTNLYLNQDQHQSQNNKKYRIEENYEQLTQKYFLSQKGHQQNANQTKQYKKQINNYQCSKFNKYKQQTRQNKKANQQITSVSKQIQYLERNTNSLQLGTQTKVQPQLLLNTQQQNKQRLATLQNGNSKVQINQQQSFKTSPNSYQLNNLKQYQQNTSISHNISAPQQPQGNEPEQQYDEIEQLFSQYQKLKSRNAKHPILSIYPITQQAKQKSNQSNSQSQHQQYDNNSQNSSDIIDRQQMQQLLKVEQFGQSNNNNT